MFVFVFVFRLCWSRSHLAAICWNKEIAKLAKQHNNANVISIPSRFLEKKEIEEIITVFLESEFEGGRHERRVKKIPKQ